MKAALVMTYATGRGSRIASPAPAGAVSAGTILKTFLQQELIPAIDLAAEKVVRVVIDGHYMHLCGGHAAVAFSPQRQPIELIRSGGNDALL